MNRAKKVILFSLLAFLSVSILSQYTEARSARTKLLAVSEINGTSYGSVADLHLDIKSGDGGVFLDTFPLTKLDTQISTRFAKEIACKQSHTDCRNIDFFYSLKSGSTIVGGPSAGS